jgi:hypothetical protein
MGTAKIYLNKKTRHISGLLFEHYSHHPAVTLPINLIIDALTQSDANIVKQWYKAQNYSVMAPMHVIVASYPTALTLNSSASNPPIDRKPLRESCGTSLSFSAGRFSKEYISEVSERTKGLSATGAARTFESRPDAAIASANFSANRSGSAMARAEIISPSVCLAA